MKMMLRLALVFSALQFLHAAEPAAPYLLEPARVFDAEDGKVHDGWVVLVTSNKIAAVGARDKVQAPTNAVKASCLKRL